MLRPSLAHCQNRAISLSHTRTYTGRAYSLGITIIGMTLQEFTTRSAEHEPALSAAPQPSPQNFAFDGDISKGLAKIARR